MRLFNLPDSLINTSDRPFYLGDIFDLKIGLPNMSLTTKSYTSRHVTIFNPKIPVSANIIGRVTDDSVLTHRIHNDISKHGLQ